MLLTDSEIEMLFLVYFKDKEGKPFKILSYQVPIARSVLEGEPRRVCIVASTRAGKSLILALSSLLYVLNNPHKKIVILAPTFRQTRIIMDYISEHIVDSPLIENMVDIDLTKDVEHLKREVSKNRITFKNFSTISLVSAEGNGARILGLGGDILILDEAELIEDSVYRTMILRMLGDNPNQSKLVLLGNAIGRNFFYESFINPSFTKIHITWRQCVAEGRLTSEFIEEQRKILTEPEFKMLYEAEFVEDLQSKLFASQWIDDSIYEPSENDKITDKTIFGADIAEMGRDFTVLTGLNKEEDIYKVVLIDSWSKISTMETVGRITQKVGLENKITVDATGIGNGVWSRLNELNYKTQKLLVGSAPTVEKDRFLNLKAQMYWNLRSLFEEHRIKIPKHPQLIKELNAMRYEITSNGKIRIIDPEKSPDFSDSCAMSCFENLSGTRFFKVVKGVY